jgi:hypothetical protein
MDTPYDFLFFSRFFRLFLKREPCFSQILRNHKQVHGLRPGFPKMILNLLVMIADFSNGVL